MKVVSWSELRRKDGKGKHMGRARESIKVEREKHVGREKETKTK